MVAVRIIDGVDSKGVLKDQTVLKNAAVYQPNVVG